MSIITDNTVLVQIHSGLESKNKVTLGLLVALEAEKNDHKVTIFLAGGAPGGISDRAHRKAQTTKQAPIPIVKAIMMSLGHSYDDLRARNRAPQPLLGGVI